MGHTVRNIHPSVVISRRLSSHFFVRCRFVLSCPSSLCLAASISFVDRDLLTKSCLCVVLRPDLNPPLVRNGRLYRRNMYSVLDIYPSLRLLLNNAQALEVFPECVHGARSFGA